MVILRAHTGAIVHRDNEYQKPFSKLNNYLVHYLGMELDFAYGN